MLAFATVPHVGKFLRNYWRKRNHWYKDFQKCMLVFRILPFLDIIWPAICPQKMACQGYYLTNISTRSQDSLFIANDFIVLQISCKYIINNYTQVNSIWYKFSSPFSKVIRDRFALEKKTYIMIYQFIKKNKNNCSKDLLCALLIKLSPPCPIWWLTQ